MKCNQYLY